MLELIVPMVNREHDARVALASAAGCLRDLAVPAGIAVVDRGSSDRTLEAVDAVAAISPVPIRAVGCSRAGWAAAALRGIATSAARWIAFAEPGAFGEETAMLLGDAVRLLDTGAHVVCVAPHGCRCSVFDAGTAALVVGEQLPDGPGFVPHLPDTARHAGLRMTFPGHAVRVSRADATVVLQRVGS
jgi:glycosyltransferase involved in cell wall biosynthesis